MFCPLCQENLEKAIFYGVEIDYCPKCLGLWLEKYELRLAKDRKDADLNWLDIDLWKDKRKFRISRDNILCPICRLPLYEIEYGESSTKIDLCSVCSGIWLDRGEFKKIIEYLKNRKDYKIFNNFSQNLIKEFWEIFAGPETLREEITDFLTILKVLNYRLFARYPLISAAITNLSRYLPK